MTKRKTDVQKYPIVDVKGVIGHVQKLTAAPGRPCNRKRPTPSGEVVCTQETRVVTIMGADPIRHKTMKIYICDVCDRKGVWETVDV